MELKFDRLFRDTRTSLMMTQEELATAIGASAAHIGSIEQGRRTPSMNILMSLASLVDEPLSLIVFRAELGNYGFTLASELPQRVQIAQIEALMLAIHLAYRERMVIEDEDESPPVIEEEGEGSDESDDEELPDPIPF